MKWNQKMTPLFMNTDADTILFIDVLFVLVMQEVADFDMPPKENL